MYDLIYQIVRKISRGKVATYGQIAQIVNQEAGSRNHGKRVNPRLVGFALHRNPDPKSIPCHRVVNGKGKLAENYAFSSKGRSVSGRGGWREQKRRLVEEGVEFKDEFRVDLEKCLWNFEQRSP